ncbi:MAG: glycosyltransferase family 2 protein [Parvularcula sp.]|jgi:GT2 family glycosyltransferase|nr:glycosyltransferase family 2 protein [Parvularcula sp.]
MSQPLVSIVITQRERFGMTQESLEDLYAHTSGEFEVIYVDGNSPLPYAEYLRKEAERRGFMLIRREHYLMPNEARNLGREAAKGTYIVFCDNDVLYTDGWLEALVACAEETGAAIVAPLTCQGLPAHQVIHHAGGLFTPGNDVSKFFATPRQERRDFIEDMHGHAVPIAEYDGEMVRTKTGMCEFHCALVRADLFDKIGPLDENMRSTKEHIDLSISAWNAGEEVWFEPTSIVTYVFPCRARPLNKDDWPFFALRWSDQFGQDSLSHFIEKWLLSVPDDYLHNKRETYKMRRMQGILIPMMAQMPLVKSTRGTTRGAARLAAPLERLINRGLVARHERQRREIIR